MRELREQSTIYKFGLASLGDVVATSPIVKYAIKNYHKNSDYRVIISKAFRALIPFVPEEKMVNLGENTNEVIPNWPMRNMLFWPKQDSITSNPWHYSHLSDVFSFHLLGHTLSNESSYYTPLEPVNISNFNLPSKFVIIVAEATDLLRSFTPRTIQEIVNFLNTTPYAPVLVGRKQMYPINKAISIIGQTDIPQLASIMGKAACVIGMDTGAIHLAGTTPTNIISGFTTIDPRLRLVRRPKGQQIVIAPDCECRFCLTKSRRFPNTECEFGDILCRQELTSSKFIAPLSLLLSSMQ